MEHPGLLIAVIQVGVWESLLDILLLLGMATLLGFFAERLKQSAVVGYLIAGTLIGPGALGWVASQEHIFNIAELGVALLLFTIGLEFSPRQLWQLGRVPLVSGPLQVVLTAVIAAAAGLAVGLSPGESIVIGGMTALSSTACVLRVLRDRAEIDSQYGRAALGILLVQDAAVVPLVLFVTALAGGGTVLDIVTKMAISILLAVLLVGAFYVLFNWLIPSVLIMPTWRRNRDLPVLLTVCIAGGAAWSAHTLQLSPALGAFVAGVLLAVSPFATQIQADIQPLRAVLVTLFFAAIKDVYLDSQVTIGLLSNVTASMVQVEGEPSRPPKNAEEAQRGEILTAAQTAAARNFVNEISGSTRMLCHGLLYVGKGNLKFIQEQIDQNEPDSWKGYNISNSAKVDDDPASLMRQWRHDDPDVAYPTFELIQKNYERLKDKRSGFNNICVHKGLAPGPADPKRGHPDDLPKAARDWPKLNFISYHACIQPNFFLADALEEVKAEKLRGGVPNISWTTEYAQLVADLPNCIAEIGTTWASSVVTFPTIAAHILGQLLKFMGEDRIVFGSDSVWYGSPQWQIEALWRFQIPAAMREKYGYPELTEAAKRKILGLNSARLYGIKTVETGDYKGVPKDYEARMTPELKPVLEVGQLRADNMTRMRETYLALAIEPEHVRYGWMRATT